MTENLVKKQEVKNQIKEMMKKATQDMIDNYIDKAFNSGALSEDVKLPQNYVLAKFIICAYFDKQPYFPHSDSFRKELKNLENFL